MIELVRFRCSFPGTVLMNRLEQTNTDLQQANTSILLFARPLWALSKWPLKMSLLALGGYAMYVFIDMVHFYNVNQSPRARHVRLTVLETRNHLYKPAIGGLTLMDNGCKHGHLESQTHGTHAAPTAATIPFQSQFNTSTFFASFPAAVLTNGWALTTSYSHDAGVCNHSCVRYDPFIRVTRLIHMCDMTYSQAGEAVVSAHMCLRISALVFTNG